MGGRLKSKMFPVVFQAISRWYRAEINPCEKIKHRKLFWLLFANSVSLFIIVDRFGSSFSRNCRWSIQFLFGTLKRKLRKKKKIPTTVSALRAVCISFYEKYRFNLFINGVMNFIFHSPHLLHLNERERVKKKSRDESMFSFNQFEIEQQQQERKQSEVILWMHAH